MRKSFAPPRTPGRPGTPDLLSGRTVTSSFSAEWLRGDPRALAFLPDRFRHKSARAEAVAAAASRTVSPALLEALVARNTRLAPNPARERNLELLSRPGTVAVVTGQQVGLFLGPLFTIYKAASAIVAARTLAEETGRPCVPVFWLQTEDHDLPEIDHCFVPRGTGTPLRLSLELSDAATSRIPVAHRHLDEGVTRALAALKAELGTQPHAGEHLELLERAYRPEATLADAFAEVLASVFADEGLVFLDPRDPRVSPFAAPIHRRALEEAAAISTALASQGSALSEAGFSEQVHIRPGSPLGFFSPDGLEGARYRLDPAASPGTWSLVGHPDNRFVTTAELLTWLEREPLRFTTSALLRPILQDTLLPTAAYVGGPGEIAYFAQLAPLYAHVGLPMPLIVPRARFRVLDDRTRGLLEKLGLSPDEATAPRDELLARLAAQAAGEGFDPPEAVEARLMGTLAPELARLGQCMAALDPSFAHAIERTEESVRTALSRLVAKYGRALGQRDQVTLERLDRLRAYLAPEGTPQERFYGLPYYACRFGARAFTRMVLEACEPFSGSLKDLRP
ncbi:bacillithiol biosynthesis cysteine-adding enzyme BshC [Hyalangium rubrum]|uniref:Putative cysteine ligase BshC n=1 Tax=Hyalangium rubrum TaxID=3103134 RepID=A0ABU5H568_9BACT|nr:bacillithiol biosynthesis cysteine-adding enzyme BshC [Hyalangium sp. s54d21]MDY7227999.1 bacillithiol biosynthesis cysteine-adding enzyme BshC [Hyalangium sp. s54d21]